MSLEPEILETLRCPVAGSPLRRMTRAELERLNSSIARGVLRCAGGATIAEPVDEALTTADGASVYGVRDGVPVLLPERRIVSAADAPRNDSGVGHAAGSSPWDERWSELSRRWDELGSPVRPAPEDTAILERFAAEACAGGGPDPRRVLILGVTPEIATMRWPERVRVLALDSSEAMIRHVWPAHAAPGGAAALADWLAMPLADNSYDLVVGDGALSVPRYPDGCATLVREVRRVLTDRGTLALRMFTRPETREPVAEVFAALRAGRIGSLDAMKWRLVMAVHGDTPTGARMGDVWDAWRAHVPDPEELMRSLGWRVDAHRILDGLRGLEARATFAKLSEIRALLAADFEEVGCVSPGYEDGARYPTMAFRARPRR